MRDIFVGGEFYDNPKWTTEAPSLNTDGSLFLNGGRACLTVIIDFLRTIGIDQVLLPTYLCPTILDVMDRGQMGYSFYRINEDLSIDLNYLESKVKHFKTVYFINYFGFLHPPLIRSFMQDLQTNGIVLIEDNAQAFFNDQFMGDFSFNSLRKFAACDGGYLCSRFDLFSILEPYHERVNHRLPIIRAYRNLLRAYLLEGRGRRSELERLFHQAEAFYEKDAVVIGDEQERDRIEHMDWNSIKRIRRENYNYLLGMIKIIPEIIPLYPALPEGIMPMGMPVYVNNVSRDRLCEFLAEESISLTVHWDALLDDPRLRQFTSTQAMAARMVTLPIDQYTNHVQLDYLVEKMSSIVIKLQ